MLRPGRNKVLGWMKQGGGPCVCHLCSRDIIEEEYSNSVAKSLGLNSGSVAYKLGETWASDFTSLCLSGNSNYTYFLDWCMAKMSRENTSHSGIHLGDSSLKEMEGRNVRRANRAVLCRGLHYLEVFLREFLTLNIRIPYVLWVRGHQSPAQGPNPAPSLALSQAVFL